MPAERTRLTSYGGRAFYSELADWVAGAQLIRLVGLEELYG